MVEWRGQPPGQEGVDAHIHIIIHSNTTSPPPTTKPTHPPLLLLLLLLLPSTPRRGLAVKHQLVHPRKGDGHLLLQRPERRRVPPRRLQEAQRALLFVSFYFCFVWVVVIPRE